MTRYGNGAIVLHWALAGALAFELALGFAMPRGASGFELFQLHKSVGAAILVLTVFRLAWRLMHPAPPSLKGGMAHKLASAVHISFYFVMIAIPLTGWAVVSSSPINVPTLIFGILPVGHLPIDQELNELAIDAHAILAWCAIGLFILHIAGAIRHELLLGDRLIARISPGGRRAVGLLLAALVIAIGTATFETVSRESDPQSAVQQSAGQSAEEDPAPPPLATESTAAIEAVDTESAIQDAPAAAPVWTIKPGGTLSFSVKHAAAGQIDGSFGRWSGNIAFDPERPEQADIRIVIDLSSASVGDPTQDTMLLGEEFLNAGSFGTATFTSRSATRNGANYRTVGQLELNGTKRSQAVSFELSGTGMNRRVQGRANLGREAFDIGDGPSGQDLDNNVTVSFSFDASGTLPPN